MKLSLAGVAACVALTAAFGPAGTRDAWAAGECNAPVAEVPDMQWLAPGSEARARGTVWCPYYYSTFSYSLKLINNAGNVLWQRSGGPFSGAGNWPVVGAWDVCTGAYVRTHLWITTHGFDKSDTSGSVYCPY
jgi:hypothetical protein